MVNYTCYKCGYDTKYKCNMKSHLERINKCIDKYNKVKLNICKKYILQGLSYVEYKELIDKNNSNNNNNNNCPQIDINCPENTIIHNNCPQIDIIFPNNIIHNNCPKVNIDTNNNKNHLCNYCSKSFSYKSKLERHLKSCKVKNNEIELLKTKIELLENKNKEYEEENKELKYIIEQKNKLIKENKSINKYTNCNNIINCNNNTTNIIVNNYIKPNKKYLNYDTKKECIYTDDVYLLPLLKELFFNKEHPENHSISYSNTRSNKMSVYNGNEWNLQNRVDIINNLIDNCDSILSKFITEIRNSNKITYKQGKMINLYDKYISNYTLNDDDYKSLHEYIYMESKNLNIKPNHF